jgi:hypothetical protein
VVQSYFYSRSPGSIIYPPLISCLNLKPNFNICKVLKIVLNPKQSIKNVVGSLFRSSIFLLYFTLCNISIPLFVLHFTLNLLYLENLESPCYLKLAAFFFLARLTPKPISNPFFSLVVFLSVRQQSDRCYVHHLNDGTAPMHRTPPFKPPAAAPWNPSPSPPFPCMRRRSIPLSCSLASLQAIFLSSVRPRSTGRLKPGPSSASLPLPASTVILELAHFAIKTPVSHAYVYPFIPVCFPPPLTIDRFRPRASPPGTSQPQSPRAAAVYLRHAYAGPSRQNPGPCAKFKNGALLY